MLYSVVGLLKKNELILSVAESCTGGLIAKYFTDFPGSSVFLTRDLLLILMNQKLIICMSLKRH